MTVDVGYITVYLPPGKCQKVLVSKAEYIVRPALAFDPSKFIILLLHTEVRIDPNGGRLPCIGCKVRGKQKDTMQEVYKKEALLAEGA